MTDNKFARSLESFGKPIQGKSFKWDTKSAQGEWNGRIFGWTSSNTPSEFINGEGWKPLIWKSYNINGYMLQRRIIRQLVEEMIEEDF